MKELRLRDLKAGYLVEFNGKLEIVVPLFYQGVETLAVVSSFDAFGCQQLLTHDLSDITKVWGLPENNDYRPWNIISKKSRKLVFSAEKVPKVKELTMAQIEEKFGCKVKVIK